MDTRAHHDGLSPYRVFSRSEWAKLRADLILKKGTNHLIEEVALRKL